LFGIDYHYKYKSHDKDNQEREQGQ
jgi:hypothetical protein